MSIFKRYDFDSFSNPLYGEKFVESSIGEWVKFDDIKELLNTAHNSRVIPCESVREKCSWLTSNGNCCSPVNYPKCTA